MASFPADDGRTITMANAPPAVRKLTHALAAWLDSLGADHEMATETAFCHVVWAAHIAGVWPKASERQEVAT